MRPKKHEEHENHERWLVSYADFITLLFAFFVVMYAISSVNEGKYKTLSSALIQAFKNAPVQPADTEVIAPVIIDTQTPMPIDSSDASPTPTAEETNPVEGEKMRGIAADILKAMEPLIKEGHVKVTQSKLGVSVEINAGVLFEPGQAMLGKRSEEVLKAVAAVITNVPNIIMIEGHTDDSPINSPTYPSNWELSSARASSVVRLFIDNGMNPKRLAAVGYADQKPMVANDSNENRAKNRRVTIRIEPENTTEIKQQWN